MKTVYVLAYNDYDGDQIRDIIYTNKATAEKELETINTTRFRYEPLYEIWEFKLDEN